MTLIAIFIEVICFLEIMLIIVLIVIIISSLILDNVFFQRSLIFFLKLILILITWLPLFYLTIWNKFACVVWIEILICLEITWSFTLISTVHGILIWWIILWFCWCWTTVSWRKSSWVVWLIFKIREWILIIALLVL